MSSPQGMPTVPDRSFQPLETPSAAMPRRASTCLADRTLRRHLPHKRVADSRHPRVRWWRIACDHLWRLVMNPVNEWSMPEFRGVDILDSYGFRIHRASGTISNYALKRRGRWLYRDHAVHQGALLVGGNCGTGWIGGLISNHAAHWAQLAGMAPEHIPRQWIRLLQALAQRWEADGTIERLRRIQERALALDDELLRLARATTQSEAGPDAVFMDGYQRCLADRANLLTVEREAPQLLRLYAMLLPGGAGAAEPKQALKRAFLDGGRRPVRLWRTMCRIDTDTIDALTAHGQCLYMNPLADWIDLLQALDLHIQPPAGWMFGMRQSFGSRALSREFAAPWARPVLAAHLVAWMAADESGRDLLFLELEDVCTDLMNLAVQPMPPSALRGWRACVRWAARMQAAQFESEAEAARAWDVARGLPRQRPAPPLRASRIELRRLLTSQALIEEGRAMQNCIHDWRDHLVDDTAAVYSVHLTRTGEHIGTATVELDGGTEERGPVNGRLAPEHRREVVLLLRREHARLWSPRIATIRPASVCPVVA